MPKTITWQSLFMSIFVIGINHKTAPVSLREKAYFALEKLPLYLQDLMNQHLATEAVLLSTCNRSELYCEAEALTPLCEWFAAQTATTLDEILPALYSYQDEDALTHIMSVACGLDSMVLGEPQILGQMKEAFSESCTVSAVGTSFHRLFQQVFTVAKEIRTTTAIGACPVSVATAAVHFANLQIPDFKRAKVVLIGAGDTTALFIRYLKTQVSAPITIINRSIENASVLAEQCGGKAYGFDALKEVLAEADVVFSATGSAIPIVQKELVEKVMQSRATRPLVFIDVAVPRDIDPQVETISSVKVYCIDDLKSMIEANRRGREHAAEKARELIQQKSAAFMAEHVSFERVSHTIRAYRGQIEDICQAEMLKARQQLQQGVDPLLVLEAFAQGYTKKLLHAPSVQLRQAGAEGRFELLRFAKQLFGIPDPEVECL